MPADETELIESARKGDEAAFERLVARERRSLHAHCYRLLGCLADADDALQETLLGAWRGLARFEGRSSLRSWLFTIATHASLRLASRRPTRIRPPDRDDPWDPRADLPELLTDIAWLEPYPCDQSTMSDERSSEARYSERESVELAFVAALQLLPAIQRAALILRDVLGFSAQETAEALDTSVAAVNSALQRARATLAQRSPSASQAANRRVLGEAAHQRLVDDFLAAWVRADVDSLVALLASDATFTMPPLPCWFRGRADVGVFFAERVFQLRWRFAPARANGQPAIAGYQWHDDTDTYRLEVLNVLDLRGDRVASISSFLGISAETFGLPASVDE